ncbi:ABC transporter substrate-binding protein [Paenibacillus physcomitrellae]|uniref:ABC transporter substrate-binding protein n=1 Tax=Paenibacillus physcomitrellae TaxID=1619311 RepID=A0ABQ1GS85_9BACL|nr:ABC transporter substrate-binding protein [Paenibacillus physcomitrellae]GGA49033.1 ABC transporter substrate-binding protein [Paenibacillus physcomitrellae]
MKGFRFKKSLLLLTTALTVALAGCGSNSGNGNAGASSNNGGGNAGAASNNSGTAAAATAAPAPVKITWWHSMSGTNEKAINEIVSDFNASQQDVQVEAVFQGAYDESLNKLKASIGSNSGPDLMQVYEIGSKFMIDSKLITPVQQFIDADNYDLSQLEPNITRYYTIDGKLNAMPFNTSNPILYYNKDAFKAAGLDPENPPKTYEDFEKAAKALAKNGKPAASIAIYGWFMEQFFANQNADYVNNGNGRQAAATESLLNSDAGVKTMEWWKRMLDEKAVSNLGRKTDDTDAAFAAGQIAMTLDSTASLRNIVQSVGGKFEVGTGFLPRPADAKEGGVVVGGASLYIMNNKPEEEQKATWEFIKYLATPEVQAKWSVNTGYFPITKAAYDQQVLKDNMAKYPQFQTAVDQLHASTESTATSGAVMGVFPEARQIVEGSIEAVLNGQKEPKAALDEAAKQITDKLAQYNKTVQ